MANPLVSVTIPVKSERFLRKALESVLSQTCRPIEVIVVSDDCADSSKQVLKEYSGRIRYFRQENTGTAAARDRGIWGCQAGRSEQV